MAVGYKKFFKQSPNYTPGSQTKSVWGVNRRVREIQIHWWGDPKNKPTFAGVVAFLTKKGVSSAHYVAEAKKVAQLVREADNAWATNKGNPFGISIECNPRASKADIETIAQLVAGIWTRYKRRLPLVPHQKYANTACPGVYLKLMDDISRRAYEILHPPKPKPSKPVKFVKMLDPRPMKVIRDTYFYNLNTGKRVTRIRKGRTLEFATKATYKNRLWLRTKAATAKNVPLALFIDRLAEVEVAEAVSTPPPKPAANDPTPESVTGGNRIGERLTTLEKFAASTKTALAKLGIKV